MATVQSSEEVKTLQQEIDYQVSKAGGEMHTFIIKDKTGDCTIPDYVNARLINCKLNSLKVSQDNILYFGNCTFNKSSGQFSAENAAIILENTTINNKTSFSNCKLEFNTSTLNQTILLDNKTYLKTFTNSWKGVSGNNNKIAVSLNNGSRLESYRDVWENWSDNIWQVTNQSFAKISEALSIKSGSGNNGLASVDTGSACILSHPPVINIVGNSDPLFTVANGSRLELYNPQNITADGVIFDLLYSKLIFREIPTLTSNHATVFSLTSSIADGTNIDKILSNGDDLVTATENSILNLNNFNSLKSTGGKVFNLTDSTVKLVGPLFDYTDDSATGASIEGQTDVAISCTNSDIFLKYIKSISSGSSKAISLVNTVLYGSGINSLSSGSDGATVDTDNSQFTLIDVKTIKGIGEACVAARHASKGSLVNVGEINCTGAGSPAIDIANHSAVVVKNVGSVIGQANGILLTNYSSVILKGLNAVKATDSGSISVGAGCRVAASQIVNFTCSSGPAITNTGVGGRISLNDIQNISGNPFGVSLTAGDFELDNSGITDQVSTVSGISIKNSGPLGSYTAKIIGPVNVSGANALEATNYVIEESGVIWSGDTFITSCIINEKLINYTGQLVVRGASYFDQISSVVSGLLTVAENSSYNTANSSIHGNTNIENSIITALSSTFSVVDLFDRAGFTLDCGNVGDIAIEDSFIRVFADKVGTVDPYGKSTVLAGSGQGINIVFESDGPFANPIAAFTASGGDLMMQADNNVIIEGDQFYGYFRTSVVWEAQTEIICAVGTSQLSILAAEIDLASSAIYDN